MIEQDTVPLSNTLDAARSWLTENVEALFDTEIVNQLHGGVSPATISSAIDSVVQAPDIMCEGWEVDDFISFLMIIDIVNDTNTPLKWLLK